MKRVLTVALCFLLFHCILAVDAFALAPAHTLSKKAVKVSEAVSHLGVGDDTIIAVRLHDGTVVKGRVSSIARYSFVVTDADTGEAQPVYYSAVDRLKGVNLASGDQVQVGLGWKSKLASVAGFLFPVRVHKNSLTNGEKTLLIGIGVGILIAIVLAKAL